MNWNRILDDEARRTFSPMIEEMRLLVPEMMARKIERANVQQAFVFDAVQQLGSADQSILAVGAHEDTAWAALACKDWPMHAVDPVWGKSLADQHTELGGRPSYDLIFATSVIEHVEDDLTFVRQIADLLRPGGFMILTADFQPGWAPEVPKPPECCRLYTPERFGQLVQEMPGCSLLSEPTWHSGEIDFDYAGCRYAFASLVVLKKGDLT